MQSVRPTFCRMASPACGPTRAIVCYVRGLKAALAIKRCAHRSHRLHAMLLEISLQHGLRLGRHLLDRPAEPAGIRTHRAPERLRARLPAVCDLWEWVDVGTHGVRERHERRRVPDASPLTTEVLQRLSACAHPRTAQPIDHTAEWPGREYVRTPQTLPLQSPRPCPRRRPRPRCPLAARSAQEAPGNGQSGIVRLGKVARARSAHGMYSGSGCATAAACACGGGGGGGGGGHTCRAGPHFGK